MKTFAFIFARGGSKGLPGKNIKPLLGKPMIAHAITLALDIPEVARVFVSTDSHKIAELATKYGAEVPFIRPKELASDTASEWLAWQHAVEYVQTNIETFDCFVSLPVTAPCREAHDVQGALSKLNGDVDIVVTASKSNRHPSFNMLKREKNGKFSKFLNSEKVVRRQDAEQSYNMTTVAYVARPDFILNAHSLWDGNFAVQEVSTLNAVDIDDVDDFKLAELILKDRLG